MSTRMKKLVSMKGRWSFQERCCPLLAHYWVPRLIKERLWIECLLLLDLGTANMCCFLYDLQCTWFNSLRDESFTEHQRNYMYTVDGPDIFLFILKAYHFHTVAVALYYNELLNSWCVILYIFERNIWFYHHKSMIINTETGNVSWTFSCTGCDHSFLEINVLLDEIHLHFAGLPINPVTRTEDGWSLNCRL